MTATFPTAEQSEIFYPSEDGTPVAETYDHLFALLATLDVLTQYLSGRQAKVEAQEEVEQERQRAEQAERRAAQLLEQLRGLGVEPDA